METAAIFAIVGIITALAYLGNPFSSSSSSGSSSYNPEENKPIAGGKKSRKRVNRGNHKSRKH